MGFADLKKQSKLGSLTAKLVKEVEKMNNNGSTSGDDRVWKLECDKSGNGYAVIRFLLLLMVRIFLSSNCTPRLPRSWRLVHRELSDHSGSEGSCF